MFGVGCDLYRVVPGDGLPPSQEVALQAAGDEDGVPHLEQDVPGALVDVDDLLALPADLFHLAEGDAGDHELKASVLFCQGLSAQG